MVQRLEKAIIVVIIVLASLVLVNIVISPEASLKIKQLANLRKNQKFRWSCCNLVVVMSWITFVYWDAWIENEDSGGKIL